MSWWQLGAGLAGAGLGYLDSQNARDNANRANQPRESESTLTPWGPVGGFLEDLVNDSQGLYNNQVNNFNSGRGRPPGYSGPNPSNFNFGPSSLSSGLVQNMADRARGGSANLDSAGNYVQGRLDNPTGNVSYSNPFLNTAFLSSMNSAPGGRNSSQLGEFSLTSPPRSSGGFFSSSSDPYNNGAGFAPGSGGNYSNPELEEFISQTLSGDFINSNPFLEEIAGSIRERSSEAEDAATAALTRRELGAGRFGRGKYASERASVSGEFADSLDEALANLFGTSYENERGRQNEIASLTNSRDVSRWGDLTNRLGINTNANIARRGQDITRYGIDSDRNNLLESLGSAERMQGLSLLSGLAGTYGDQDLGYRGLNTNADLAALGMVPELEEAGWLGFNNAFGSSMALDQMSNEAESRRAGIAEANARNRHSAAMNRWNYEQNALPGFLDAQLGRLTGLGATFGTRTGMDTPPYTPAPSATQGAVGGFLNGLGNYNQYRQMFGGNAASNWTQGLNNAGITHDPFTGNPYPGQQSSNLGGGSSRGGSGGGGGSFGSSPYNNMFADPSMFGISTTFPGYGSMQAGSPVIPFEGYGNNPDYSEPQVNLYGEYVN